MLSKLIKLLKWIPLLIDVIDEIIDILEERELITNFTNRRLTKKIKDGKK